MSWVSDGPRCFFPPHFSTFCFRGAEYVGFLNSRVSVILPFARCRRILILIRSSWYYQEGYRTEGGVHSPDQPCGFLIKLTSWKQSSRLIALFFACLTVVFPNCRRQLSSVLYTAEMHTSGTICFCFQLRMLNNRATNLRASPFARNTVTCVCI